MPGFVRAVADGADGIEFDVQRTADGAFVVIHDFTLDRTTSGSGLVNRSHIEDVRSLDAGSWFSVAYAGVGVPTLEQVLSINDVEFELELKVFESDDLAALADQVVSVGVLDRVEFTSSNSPMLMALKDSVPGARIGVFSPRRLEWMHDETFISFVTSRAAFAGADVVHVHAQDVTAAVANALHARGFQVHANDSDTEEDLDRALSAGADRTTTNDPGWAVSQLS